MKDLSPCHSRRELPQSDDRFVCLHPKVHAQNNIVPYEVCRQCGLWREPPPAEFRVLPPRFFERLEGACRHLGDQTGLRDCPTCRGHVRVKVFACRHPNHVETTLAECEQCRDFEFPLPSGEGRGEGGLPTTECQPSATNNGQLSTDR